MNTSPPTVTKGSCKEWDDTSMDDLLPSRMYNPILRRDGIEDLEVDVANWTEIGNWFRPPQVVEVSKSTPLNVHQSVKWVGTVTTVGVDSFVAHLRTDESDTQTLEAEFALDELGLDERARLIEGVGIVWAISRITRGSTTSNNTVLYLRRAVKPSDEDAKIAAEQLSDLFR